MWCSVSSVVGSEIETNLLVQTALHYLIIMTKCARAFANFIIRYSYILCPSAKQIVDGEQLNK